MCGGEDIQVVTGGADDLMWDDIRATGADGKGQGRGGQEGGGRRGDGNGRQRREGGVGGLGRYSDRLGRRRVRCQRRGWGGSAASEGEQAEEQEFFDGVHGTGIPVSGGLGQGLLVGEIKTGTRGCTCSVVAGCLQRFEFIHPAAEYMEAARG